MLEQWKGWTPGPPSLGGGTSNTGQTLGREDLQGI